MEMIKPSRNFELIEEIDSRKRKIFDRLLYLLRLYPDGVKQRIELVLKTKDGESKRLATEAWIAW